MTELELAAALEQLDGAALIAELGLCRTGERHFLGGTEVAPYLVSLRTDQAAALNLLNLAMSAGSPTERALLAAFVEEGNSHWRFRDTLKGESAVTCTHRIATDNLGLLAARLVITAPARRIGIRIRLEEAFIESLIDQSRASDDAAASFDRQSLLDRAQISVTQAENPLSPEDLEQLVRHRLSTPIAARLEWESELSLFASSRRAAIGADGALDASLKARVDAHVEAGRLPSRDAILRAVRRELRLHPLHQDLVATYLREVMPVTMPLAFASPEI